MKSSAYGISETMEKIVFLDTNCYMHYRPIEEIDWRRVVGGGPEDPVRIVLPRVVVNELDRHKDAHPQAKMRERVRGVLQRIEEWGVASKPATIRPDVTLEFVAAPPSIDFGEYGLDPSANDSQLIAGMLAFRDRYQDADAEVVLVSHDTGPRLTAGSLGFVTMALSDEYRLPDTLGASEKQFRELQREVERLKGALPRLKIAFSADGTSHKRVVVRRLGALPQEKLDQAVRMRRATFPLKPIPPRLPGGLWPMGSPSPEALSAYNEQLKSFYERYARYLKAQWHWSQVRAHLTARLGLLLMNDGTAPADDLSVQLHFPGDIKLFDEESLPKSPQEPSPPEEPKSPLDLLAGTAPYLKNLEIASPLRFPAPERNVSSPAIRRTDNGYDVRIEVRRARHGIHEALPMLVLQFGSFEGAKSFGVEYVIRAANLPEPVGGKLHVVVQQEERQAG